MHNLQDTVSNSIGPTPFLRHCAIHEQAEVQNREVERAAQVGTLRKALTPSLTLSHYMYYFIHPEDLSRRQLSSMKIGQKHSSLRLGLNSDAMAC